MRFFVRFIHFVCASFYYNWCYLYYWNYLSSEFKDKDLYVCRGQGDTCGLEHKWFKCKDCPYNKRYERRIKNVSKNS